MRTQLVRQAMAGDVGRPSPELVGPGRRLGAFAIALSDNLRDVERAQDAVRPGVPARAWRELPRLRVPGPLRVPRSRPAPRRRLLRGRLAGRRRCSGRIRELARPTDRDRRPTRFLRRSKTGTALERALPAARRRNIGRSSSCTTTSACRWPRPPRPRAAPLGTVKSSPPPLRTQYAPACHRSRTRPPPRRGGCG